MICDFNSYPAGHTFQADVCIVGAGAAGITLALEFIGAGRSVLVLEGGGLAKEPASEDLYGSEVVGLPHKGVHDGRARVFGGATTLWAGQTLPLDALDFEERPWVPGSGWPFPRAELEPYYRRAERILHLGPMAYDAGVWPYPAPPPPRYDRSKLRPLISQFSPKQDFGVTYRSTLHSASNITILLHANAAALRADPSARTVDHVEIRSLSRKTGKARARAYVICCGGIETARLLLASDDVAPAGLGNQNDLVGRYFQDHVQVQAAPIREQGADVLRSLYQPFYWRGIAYVPKAAVSEELQQRCRILNATAGVTYEQFSSKDSPVEAAKRLIRGVARRRWDRPVHRDAAQVIRHPAAVGQALYRRFVQNQPAFRMEGHSFIGLQCECDPNPESRVTLSREVDAIGVRRTRLNWQLTPLVYRTISVAVRTIADELARLGMGETNPEDLAKFEDPAGNGLLKIFDANHHMGTTRMSCRAAAGVVDSDCRVHGVDNLFISSSSVFPTGGHSNPTFTILALAVRLADHLKAGTASP